jgi:thymidine phosphorylase
VANAAGLRTRALVTDMDAPLASSAGNAVEVAYAVDYLTGRAREPRFHAVTLALAAEMLVIGGLAADVAEAEARLTAALESGRACEVFARMVTALGGPGDLVEAPERYLKRAPVVRPVTAPRSGVVERIETRAIGLAVIDLGGGRTRPQDSIDPSVGFTGLVRPGDRVEKGDPIGMVHAADEASAARAESALRSAYRIGMVPDACEPVVERLG